MRPLVRDTERATTQLGTDFECAQGSVLNSAAVRPAGQGMEGVHLSPGVEDPAQLEPVEHRGAAMVNGGS